MSHNIVARDTAEQHYSLFNLKTFGINNNVQVVYESKVSKIDSKA
jgi:zona occludens toxin (predicted ATPase)